MFEHRKIQKLDDYFTELTGRGGRWVYFYRINGYSALIAQFILRYYEAARKSGVVIEGRIPNPDEQNLSYYNEIMGMDFQMSPEFISAGLKKWLPRMRASQRESVAASIYDSLDSLYRAGKNENIVKNAYIKFMCWLYYKFERIVNQLGEDSIPKILYEGTAGRYELMLLSMLSNAGCDVVLLQYHGDTEYLKLDPQSMLSDCLQSADMMPFPESFSLRSVWEKRQLEINNERLYGQKPEMANCTNAWITGRGLEDVKQPPAARGMDKKLFYNCFLKINGAEDKAAYLNQLYQFQLELKAGHRRLVVVNESIALPTMEEIAAIRRKNYNYTKQEQMLSDLSGNIRYTANIELQRLMVKAFLDVMLMEAEADGSLNKLTNKAVYLLCWLNRYQSQLFSNWKPPDIGCFIYMGGCGNGSEALFLKFLARLPVDVVLLHPDRSVSCCLKDSLLYEIHYEHTLNVRRFPQEDADVQFGTAAYHAERELDTLLYEGSGMYRNQQYAKANAVTLRTMYEEIKILWKEELKYRPNFSTVNGAVNLPVIFAKVSGVKDGAVSQYWAAVRELLAENVYVAGRAPFITSAAPNPMKTYAAGFFKNGRLQRTKMKEHPAYPYGYIREDMQEHMLDKLQLLIERRLIRGTFENGTEYTIIATALNLPKALLQLMQKFDFTKRNPKFIYINTKESAISLEDSILAAYLNLIGFDVLFFIPTGYQCIEKHFSNRKLIEEHQIGEYVYDLQVPDFNDRQPAASRWRDLFFKKGSGYGN